MDEDVGVESSLATVEGGYNGHEGVCHWWDDFLGAFPDYTLAIDELRADCESTIGRLHGEIPIVDPFWHAMKRRDGTCVWWRTCATR